ncbi:MAG: alpha/beta fold hydrolase [Gallionella sp.]|nr:alpha/beta fold hydrolase [Gallionella sp.]
MEKLISTEDGLTLWSEAFGKPTDSPVLLIMGAMNQGIFWPDEFCQELAQSGNFVIRYDHRDTGKSSTVDFQKQPYDLNVLMQDALAVLHGYKAKKAVIVGLSMGGYIAQLIAINSPSIVGRLVLISTTADHRPYMAATMGLGNKDFSLPAPEDKLLDYIRATVANPPKTVLEVEENLIQGWAITYGGKRAAPTEQIAKTLRLCAQRSINPSTGYNHALAVSASPDRLESIKLIQAPTLIIHGKYDALLPLAHAEYLAKNIPKSQLVILEMGHSFMWSWSNEVLSNIVKFVKS